MDLDRDVESVIVVDEVVDFEADEDDVNVENAVDVRDVVVDDVDVVVPVELFDCE